MGIKKIIRPIYLKLPQNIRMPLGYKKMHDFYSEAQWWSKEKILNWQLLKLKSIISYAYNNVPGYYQLYREAHVTPREINKIQDITILPFVDKPLIRDNLKDFTSQKMPKRKMRYCTTGGSTGIPMGFYYNKMSGIVEYSFMHSAWETTGWNLNDIGVVLRGAFIGSKENYFSKIEYKRYALSTYYLSETTYELYKRKILKIKPSFLHAYPSSAFDLASLVIQNNDIGIIKFDSIFLGSENLYSWQIKIISQAFPSAKIMCWYGHTERAIWAPWCEHQNKYHVSPFYGFTEILGDDDIEVNLDQTGELVGTSFWMKATPFIRYRTMDYAIKGEPKCDKCGRNHQLLESIEGRLQEIVVSKAGRRISMTSINMHDKTFDNVSQFRFVQNKPGEILLFIVPKSTFNIQNEKNIIKTLEAKLGADFILTLVKTDYLSRSASGKYSFLEQNIDIEHSDRVSY